MAIAVVPERIVHYRLVRLRMALDDSADTGGLEQVSPKGVETQCSAAALGSGSLWQVSPNGVAVHLVSACTGAAKSVRATRSILIGFTFLDEPHLAGFSLVRSSSTGPYINATDYVGNQASPPKLLLDTMNG